MSLIAASTATPVKELSRTLCYFPVPKSFGALTRRSVCSAKPAKHASAHRDRSAQLRCSAEDVDDSARRVASEAMSEVLFEECMHAVATGDADELAACLAEAEAENVVEVKESAHRLANQAEAEILFEDCMNAVATGDIEELAACVADAEVQVNSDLRN